MSSVHESNINQSVCECVKGQMHGELLRKPVASCPGATEWDRSRGPVLAGNPELHLAEASVLFHRFCLQ